MPRPEADQQGRETLSEHAASDAARIAEPTAIIHDWFQGFHGSERVVDAIRAGLFAPGNAPDVFTFHAARELLPRELAESIVRESRLAALPGMRQRGHDPGHWRLLFPAMPRYFRALDLNSYDVVIASSHAFAVQVRPRRDAIFVCYCHTPIRWAWLPGEDRRSAALRPLLGRLRRLDLEASRRPDCYVANSQAVRERIHRSYGRDSVVIHPPVEVGEFDPAADKEPGHFLWVNRLVAYKRPEAVAEAFRDLPYRLTMVGIGPLEASLRTSLPPNVTLHSWLPREQLTALYARASGYLHVGEEDFGISMVEALAAGTPVIGLARGGALDIVRDGVDGVLVARADPVALRAAIERVASEQWDRAALRARAEEFSRERFVERLGSLIQSLRR
ncbi:MAG TPA: glycosyltransferase [Solirubrobacteraceae bacterium]|nr:glycosyltransferase [Solirubrobacteraceae bacterium]